MKAQEASSARRPEKTFTATRPDTARKGNRNPPATRAKTLVQVRLDPELTAVIAAAKASTPHPRPPRRLPRPELQGAFCFERQPQGSVLRQGEKRGCGDEQRVPAENTRVRTDGKTVPERKTEMARPIEGHAADHGFPAPCRTRSQPVCSKPITKRPTTAPTPRFGSDCGTRSQCRAESAAIRAPSGAGRIH